MKIVIVGAGIGGLALGVALRRRGHEVHVVEKRAESRLPLGSFLRGEADDGEPSTPIEMPGRRREFAPCAGRSLLLPHLRPAELE
jgi:glycine/D-amino acid oxidase-like deaminating enzyme